MNAMVVSQNSHCKAYYRRPSRYTLFISDLLSRHVNKTHYGDCAPAPPAQRKRKPVKERRPPKPRAKAQPSAEILETPIQPDPVTEIVSTETATHEIGRESHAEESIEESAFQQIGPVSHDVIASLTARNVELDGEDSEDDEQWAGISG